MLKVLKVSKKHNVKALTNIKLLILLKTAI